jgi:hypothetical protein
MIEAFERAAQTMVNSPLRHGSAIRLPACSNLQAAGPSGGRLLATGDLHDNPLHMRKILALAQLEKSSQHHVALHEIIHGERLINGLDFSHRMLARIAELVIAYPLQAHPVLANHELAQLTGKGISKGAGNSVEMFNDGLEYVFGDEWLEVDAAIKRFIAAMPLALISANRVLCAHSLPGPHMMAKFDLTVLDRALQPDDYAAPFGSAHLMVWGRGHTSAQIHQLAQAWKVELFCLGHEHVASGAEARGDRVLILNSDHERAAALPIDLSNSPPGAQAALEHVIPLAAVGE